jgi:hypothetical protein
MFYYKGRTVDAPSTSGTCPAWNSFIQSTIDLPFTELEYKSITLTSVIDQYNDKGVVETNATCSDNRYVSKMLRSVVAGELYQANCEQNNWRVYQCNGASYICVNCRINCVATESCPGQSFNLNPCYSDCHKQIAVGSILSLSYSQRQLYPDIASIRSSSDSGTSIQIKANVSGPGYLFCVAKEYGSASMPTVAEIFGSSYFGFVQNYSAQVQIQNLYPETNYTLYCGTSSYQQNLMPIEQILKNRLTMQTQCCRSIVPIQTASSIYVYTPTSTNLPVFILGLNSPPRVNKRVRMSVSLIPIPCQGQTSIPSNVGSSYVVKPSTFLFDSSSIDWTASFFIQSTIAACYRINATARGYWSPPNVTVAVRAIRSTPAPPVLLSAILSNSGNSILVSFETASNMGQGVINGLFGRFACSQILLFPSSSNFTCFWSNNDRLIVIPNQKQPQVAVGQIITLRNNVLRAACASTNAVCSTYSFSAAQNVSLQGPLVPARPKVVLLASRMTFQCDDLLLDATAAIDASGQPWKRIEWSVSSTHRFANYSQNLEDYLNANATSTVAVITVPSYLLDPSVTYSISLILTNIFGFSGIGTVDVAIITLVQPQVRLYGASFVYYRWQSINLFAIASFPSCSLMSNYSIQYSWIAYDGIEPAPRLSSSSNNPRVFLLDKYQLVPGRNYTVKVLAAASTATNTAKKFGTAAFTFFVGRSGLAARIGGGSEQSISLNQSLVLDASGSFDIDFPDSNQGLMYTWSCIATFPNRGSACGGFVASSAPSIVVVGSRLGEGIFNVTVTIFNSNGTFASSSVQVAVVSRRIPLVSISTTKSVYNAKGVITILGRLNAVNGTGVISTWSSTSFGTTGLRAPIAITPLSQLFAPGVRSYALGINGDLLTPGVKYTFSISGQYVNSGGVARASVTFRINSAPTGGIVTVTPASGTAGSTVFSLNTKQWTDDDLPLSYIFSYFVQDASRQVVVKSYDQVPYAESYLRQGIESLEFRVTCVSTAYDIYEGSGNTTSSVIVTPLPFTSTAIGTAITSLRRAVIDQSVSQIVQLINVIGAGTTAVTCDVSVLCSSLFRYECQSVPNVCGACLPGYVGIDGAYNSVCLASAVASTRKAVGLACSTNADCVTDLCSSNFCRSPTRACPASCSGHGTCIFQQYGEVVMGACSALDQSCRATCVCQSGFYGQDCSQSQSQYTLKRSVISSMCLSLQQSQTLQDVSASSINSVATSILTFLTDPTFVSDYALGVCTSALTDVLIQYPSMICSIGDVFTTVVEALSVIAGRGQANSTLASVNAALSAISSACQSTFAVGQTPLSISTQNIRFTSMLLDPSSIQLIPSASTTFEQINGAPVAGVGLVLNDLVDNPSVGLSILQYNNNPYSFVSNATALMFQADVFGSLIDSSSSSSRRRLQVANAIANVNVTVNVTIQNTNPIYYHVLQPSIIVVRCLNRTASGYSINVTCPDRQRISLYCPPNTKGVHNVSCVGHIVKPTCLVSDGRTNALVSATNCAVSAFSSLRTTCTCEGPLGTISGLHYASRLIELKTSFSQSFTVIPQIFSSPSTAMATFVVASVLGSLGLFLLIAIRFAAVAQRQKKKVYVTSTVRKDEFEPDWDGVLMTGQKRFIKETIVNLLPRELSGMWETWQDLWWQRLIIEHSLLCIIIPDSIRKAKVVIHTEKNRNKKQQQSGNTSKQYRTYVGNPTTDEYNLGYGWKLIYVSGRALCIVFLATIFTNFFFRDDGTCDSIDHEYECMRERSYYDVFAKCNWIAANESCIFQPPNVSTLFLLTTTMFIVLFANWISWFLFAWMLSIQRLLDRWVPIAATNNHRTHQAVVAVSAAGSMLEEFSATSLTLGEKRGSRSVVSKVASVVLGGSDDVDIVEVHPNSASWYYNTKSRQSGQDVSYGGHSAENSIVSYEESQAQSGMMTYLRDLFEFDGPKSYLSWLTSSTGLKNRRHRHPLPPSRSRSASPVSRDALGYHVQSIQQTVSPSRMEDPALDVMSHHSGYHKSKPMRPMSSLYSATTMQSPLKDVSSWSHESDDYVEDMMPDDGIYDEFEQLQTWRTKLWRAARITKAQRIMDVASVEDEVHALLAYIQHEDARKLFSRVMEYKGLLDIPTMPIKYDSLGKNYNLETLRWHIENSRAMALQTSRRLQFFPTVEEQGRYLLSMFIWHLLPNHLQGIFHQFLIENQNRVNVQNRFTPMKNLNEHPFSWLAMSNYVQDYVFPWVSLLLLLTYFALLAFFTIYIGRQSLVQDNVHLWALLLFASFIELFCLHEPLYILIHSVGVKYLVLSTQLQALLHHLASRGRLIFTRSNTGNNGFMSNANCKVQHLNPACRCARFAHFSALPVSRLLLGMNDTDVRYPLLPNEEAGGQVYPNVRWQQVQDMCMKYFFGVSVFSYHGTMILAEIYAHLWLQGWIFGMYYLVTLVLTDASYLRDYYYYPLVVTALFFAIVMIVMLYPCLRRVMYRLWFDAYWHPSTSRNVTVYDVDDEVRRDERARAAKEVGYLYEIGEEDESGENDYHHEGKENDVMGFSAGSSAATSWMSPPHFTGSMISAAGTRPKPGAHSSGGHSHSPNTASRTRKAAFSWSHFYPRRSRPASRAASPSLLRPHSSHSSQQDIRSPSSSPSVAGMIHPSTEPLQRRLAASALSPRQLFAQTGELPQWTASLSATGFATSNDGTMQSMQGTMVRPTPLRPMVGTGQTLYNPSVGSLPGFFPPSSSSYSFSSSTYSENNLPFSVPQNPHTQQQSPQGSNSSPSSMVEVLQPPPLAKTISANPRMRNGGNTFQPLDSSSGAPAVLDTAQPFDPTNPAHHSFFHNPRYNPQQSVTAKGANDDRPSSSSSPVYVPYRHRRRPSNESQHGVLADTNHANINTSINNTISNAPGAHVQAERHRLNQQPPSIPILPIGRAHSHPQQLLQQSSSSQDSDRRYVNPHQAQGAQAMDEDDLYSVAIASVLHSLDQDRPPESFQQRDVRRHQHSSPHRSPNHDQNSKGGVGGRRRAQSASSNEQPHPSPHPHRSQHGSVYQNHVNNRIGYRRSRQDILSAATERRAAASQRRHSAPHERRHRSGGGGGGGGGGATDGDDVDDEELTYDSDGEGEGNEEDVRSFVSESSSRPRHPVYL